MTNVVPDLHVDPDATQCFPLYWYEERTFLPDHADAGMLDPLFGDTQGQLGYEYESDAGRAETRWVRHDCLWSNKAVRCRHLFWTVMAFILDSVGGRHRCDMRAPVPLVS